MMRSWRDRAVVGAMRAVPKSLGRHLLFLLQTQPAVADALGYHVRRVHYYDPLPDFSHIDPSTAARRREPAAVDFDLPRQRALLDTLASRRGEIEAIAAAGTFDFANDYFAGFDAAAYYALIRELQPRRVIEIGAGMSTRIADLALQRNRADGRPGDLICIEPFPQPRLTDNMPAITLMKQRVETVPLETFDALDRNDILFIDSSHAAKFGSDVCFEFLEVLPRIKPGVWIHVHDIFFPHDYPVPWLVQRRLAFNEQYVLEAFLAFNRAFVPRLANHWLAREHHDEAAALAPEAVWPRVDAGSASFWMQRVQ